MSQQQIKEIANRCSLKGDEPWMADFVGLVLEAVVAEIRNCFSRGGPPDDPHPDSVIYNNGVQSALEAVQEFAGQSLAPIPEQAVASLSAEDAAIIARQVFDWTKERDRLQDLIDTATGKSGAPIPEQVAQASGIAGLTPPPKTADDVVAFIGNNYESMEDAGDIEDIRFQVSVHDLVSAFSFWFEDDLATQSAKQSNLQEENCQLRERIEDLTTAANQCINDAIGQSAQEVTQQAAKAETAEQANSLPPTRGTGSQHDVDSASLRLVQKLSTISMRLAADLVSGADYTFQGHDYLDRDTVVNRVMEWRREWDYTHPARAELASRFREGGK